MAGSEGLQITLPMAYDKPMILQSRVPYDPLTSVRLPGIQPLDPARWLLVDEAYAGQMARRRALIDARGGDVIALHPDARPAADELVTEVLAHLARDHGDAFTITPGEVRCPDGHVVARDPHDPLGTLGRIVQEDLCLMEKRGAEHVLTGAVLCFPASWTLSEKFMRPMTGVHAPVEEYDDALAARVQRLFDGVREGRPLWRFNALFYDDPELFQPRREADKRTSPGTETGAFLRTERQSLLRLPRTRAVVFAIHTYVLDAAPFRAAMARKGQ